MLSASDPYLRKAADTVTYLPPSHSFVFLVYVAPLQDDFHLFPERLAFIPNRLCAFFASSELPYPDSRIACAAVIEESTPLRFMSAFASGPIYSTNCFSVKLHHSFLIWEIVCTTLSYPVIAQIHDSAIRQIA